MFSKIVLSKANATGGKGEGFLNEILLIQPTDKIEEKLEKLYNLRQRGCDVDNDIDKLFCFLYGLTDEETNFIIK